MSKIVDHSSKLIIGITGLPGAGKSVVTDILKKDGFRHIVSGDIVRAEAFRQGVTIEDRYKFHEIANALHAKRGPAALVLMAIETIRASVENLWVFDGIRNPAQIVELKKEMNALILGITANRGLLMDRILSRKRTGDPKTPKEAEELLDREWGMGAETYGLQVGQCMPMADEIIENNGTLAELEKKITDFFNRIKASA
jgi:dephospho-CoA kinase